MQRALVLGANGQLGSALHCVEGYGFSYEPVGHAGLDITTVTEARLRDYYPNVVINAAAYTAVDKAESDSATAFKVNSEGPRALASACAALEIPLVHVSTDYVFDGELAGREYREDDATNPLGVYGRSKLEGEKAIRETLREHLIVRTSWVYSADGTNFVKTMLRLGAERDELRVVDDQVGRPTSANELAHAIAAMALAISDGSGAFGTYHFAGAQPMTWCAFARAIFAKTTGKTPHVTAITTADYPTPARRPKNSRLDRSRAIATFGLKPHDFDSELAACVRALEGERR